MPGDEHPFEVLRAALDEHDTVEDAARAITAQAPSFIVRWRDALQRSELEALDRWGEALACVEALHVACMVVASAFEDEHVPQAQDADDSRTAALRLLSWGSITAAGECVALLRAGYANGALARWRLLHESDVLALLLAQMPPHVSERYFEHSAMRRRQMRHSYQEWALAAGAEPHTSEEMYGMKTDEKALIDKYGATWAGEYGWAHEPLLSLDHGYAAVASRGRGRPTGPSFTDLQGAVMPRGMRLHYASANRTVHFTLDTGHDQLPAGPQPDELRLPGALVAGSIPTATGEFIRSWPPDDPDPQYVEMVALLDAMSARAIGLFAPEEAPDSA